MKGAGLAVAVVAATVGVCFAGITLALEVPSFFDPCLNWGMRNGGRLEASTPSCPNGTGGTSETKAEAMTRLVLIQGVILAACALGLWGTVRDRPILTIVAAALLFAESIPLVFGGTAILTLCAGALFLLATRLGRNIDRGTRWVMRFFGALCGATALYVLGATLWGVVRSGANQDAWYLLFVLLLCVPLAALALLAWLPDRRSTPPVAPPVSPP